MTTAMMYEPYHGIHTPEKFEALVQDMLANSWQGAPVVADGDCLITGSHRWAAVRKIEEMYEAGETDTLVELIVVDIRDIYPEFDAHMDDYDNPTIDEPMYAMAVDALPSALKDEYGIDMQ